MIFNFKDQKTGFTSKPISYPELASFKMNDPLYNGSL